jgi:itaconate CoA-transferase
MRSEATVKDADASAPLSGITVVALEQAVAAPLCTRHMADLGADVIKLERPDGGDFARGYDTVVRGMSTWFVWLNRGKRSAIVDLRDPAGLDFLHRLLSRTDVFVHNLGPGSVDRIGLGWEVLHARWPQVISCSISGYGRDGPYRDRKAFDLLLQGESGVMDVTGTASEKAKVGISIADISAGVYAFSSILAALLHRQRTGEGRLIDISMLECLAEWMMAPAYHQIYAGRAPARVGTRHSTIVPYGPFLAADGALVNFAVHTEGQWERLCTRVLRKTELVGDFRFASNELRVRNRTALEQIIDSILSSLASAELEARLAAADVPFGHVNTVAELVSHPQLTARGRWMDVDSEAGPLRALAAPFNLVGVRQRPGSVPRHGEHTEELKRELERPQ